MNDVVSLRTDLSRLEVVHTDEMQWEPSPSAGVERKRLSLAGPAEAGRVTSVVRYAPGSRFSGHPHPDGEEILVLSGVFSDERGDHPAGTFLLNPQGYSHAPRSEPGCELFVKLRQYPGLARAQVRIDTTTAKWEPYAFDGVERLLLFAAPEYPESMHLLRIAAGASIPTLTLEGGEELFVLDGTLSDEHGHYRPGTWVRYPPGTRHTPHTADGCRLYIKRGHLAHGGMIDPSA